MKAFLGILALLAVSPARADDLYASVAYSPLTHGVGTSVDQASLVDAARAARFACGDESCRPVITIGNQCASVAIGGQGGLGWANAHGPKKAEKQALGKCHDVNDDCRILRTVCTTTRKR